MGRTCGRHVDMMMGGLCGSRWLFRSVGHCWRCPSNDDIVLCMRIKVVVSKNVEHGDGRRVDVHKALMTEMACEEKESRAS